MYNNNNTKQITETAHCSLFIYLFIYLLCKSYQGTRKNNAKKHKKREKHKKTKKNIKKRKKTPHTVQI